MAPLPLAPGNVAPEDERNREDGMRDLYDVTIIGSGLGGYVAAIRAAQKGAKVALIEKARLGGTCLNRGCIPTKAMIRDAEVYRDATSGIYCVDAEGGFRLDFDRLMRRKRQVVDSLVGGVARLMAAYAVEMVTGTGRVLGPGLVEVVGGGQRREIASKVIIIATGSVPARVPIPGTELPGVLTSDDLLELQALPKSMVVVGGSVIGLEFACIFLALGAQVTVLGRKSFLKEAEQRLAKRLRSLLSRNGMSITIGVDFKRIVRGADGLGVEYERRGQARHVEGEVVLLATGRWPYTDGLGLDNLDLAMNGRAIAVNERLETSVPGIYAVGDCIGGHMLAHVAAYEAEVAVENALGGSRRVDYRLVPNCIFTMPQIADVGLTEAQAKKLGLEFVVTRFPFAVNGRALAMGETEGQIRMICEKHSDGGGGRVLGVHIMGPHADDLIAEAALAMRLGATASQIAHTIHAHPTLPEAMMEVAMAQGEGAIHFQHK